MHTPSILPAVVVTALLLQSSAGDLPRFLTMLVFGLSLCLLFAVSAIYHPVQWRERAHHFWRTFDHRNIFLFIAATYTPICLLLLDNWWLSALLAAVWLAAGAGITGQIVSDKLPRCVRVSLYIGMGALGLGLGLGLLPVIVTRLGWAPALLSLAAAVTRAAQSSTRGSSPTRAPTSSARWRSSTAW